MGGKRVIEHRKRLIHKQLILEILEALKGPEEIAVVHVRGHQKGTSLEIRGDNLADREAREAAETGSERIQMILTADVERWETPKFSKAEERGLIKIERNKDESGKWKLFDGRQLLSKLLAGKILENID